MHTMNLIHAHSDSPTPFFSQIPHLMRPTRSPPFLMSFGLFFFFYCNLLSLISAVF